MSDQPERQLRIVADYQILTDAAGQETRHPRGTVLPESAWQTSKRHVDTMIRVGDLEVVPDAPPPVPEPPAPEDAAPPDTVGHDVGEGDV